MTGAPQRRLDNIQHAQELLGRAGIAFQPVNNGAALLVSHNGLRVEFTPGNGGWRVIGTGYEARGAKELIRFLTERPGPATVGRWWYAGDERFRAGLYTIGLWGGEVYVLRGLMADAGEVVTTPTPISRLTGRWARALNPLTGEVL